MFATFQHFFIFSLSVSFAFTDVSIDLSEVNSGLEGLCAFTGPDNNQLQCSNVPMSCETLCNLTRHIHFTDNLQEITSFAFKNYFIGGKFEIKFQNVYNIEEDAFNGLFIEDAAELHIYFEVSEINQMQLQISPFAFRGIILMSNSSLHVHISQYNSVQFMENSLNAIRQINGSNVSIRLNDINELNFDSDCAIGWTPNGYEDSDDLIIIDDSVRVFEKNSDNEEFGISFHIIIDKVKTTNFHSISFNNIRQTKKSSFKIVMQESSIVNIQESSFDGLEQNFESIFELSISSDSINLDGNTFANLKQHEKSSFLFNLNIHNSDLCLSNRIFQNITQDFNSYILVNINNYDKNLMFGEEFFSLVRQNFSSLFSLNLSGQKNVIVLSDSFNNLLQDHLSIFEININDVENFIANEKSLKSFAQADESTIKIAFQSHNGKFDQHQSSFEGLRQKDSSKFIIDVDSAAEFKLGFINEASYINRTTYSHIKPKQISLLHSKFNEAFFCNIIDIHSNVFVRLNEKSACDCSIFYLYRTLRRNAYKNYFVENLRYLPKCYQNLLIDDSKSIEERENSCQFGTRVHECRSQESTHNENLFTSVGKCKSGETFTNTIKDYDYAYINTNNYQDSAAPSSLFSSFSTLSIIIVVITVVFIMITFALIALIIEIKSRSTLYDSDLDDSVVAVAGEKSVSPAKFFSFIRKKNSNSNCLSSNSASFLISSAKNKNKKAKKCLIAKIDQLSANKTLLELQAENSNESNACAKILNSSTTMI